MNSFLFFVTAEKLLMEIQWKKGGERGLSILAAFLTVGPDKSESLHIFPKHRTTGDRVC